MNRGYTGGKRQREAERDRRKKAKEERLRYNRDLRARGITPEGEGEPDMESAAALPEVRLEDVVIGVASRPRGGAVGPTKLFVGGLSSETTTEQLRAAFSRFGTITDVAVIPDRATGRSRGFGFVTFETAADAMEAVKTMNGAELDGRTLKVNRAEAR
jgi:RNA recognition motif. (a.k.a. RRM, RBD, or RNP domain)